MDYGYKIVTDSSCDLTPEMSEELGLTVAQLDVVVDGAAPRPDCEVLAGELYGALRAKKSAQTAAVSIGQFTEIFDKILRQGSDILFLGFSSGLSSTYHSGEKAAEDLRAKYPERRILTVDTLSASLGEGLLVYLTAKKRLGGATLDEAYKYAEDTKLHLCHWFTVEDLFFLKRGGRISAATAVVGSMLNIRPVMHMDNDGHLINMSKARGRRASLNALCDKMKETAIDPNNQTIFISHGDSREDAEYLAELIKEKIGVKDVMIGYVGPVIGAHSGPGTIALFFIGTER